MLMLDRLLAPARNAMSLGPVHSGALTPELTRREHTAFDQFLEDNDEGHAIERSR